MGGSYSETEGCRLELLGLDAITRTPDAIHIAFVMYIYIMINCNFITSPSVFSHQLQSPPLSSVGPRCSSDTHRSPPHDWPASGWTPPSPAAQPPSPHCCCSPAWPGRRWPPLPVGLSDSSRKEGYGFDLWFANQISPVMIHSQLRPYLCPWPSPGWSRHQALEFLA